ncbi:hypothetical protein K1998_004196, partial [Salmonella enterica subsp. enterica serovar Typhi]|nr:hypothetical protein [Salmonella enterica subsp. enterica serovar Typhi]
MFSKIVSLLLFTILSVSSYAQVLVSNIPVFDLAKLNQEGLAETQAQALLVLSLKNKKYNITLPSVFMDEALKNDQGKPFHSGYYSFGVGYDSPSVGATDIWGLFSVSPKTGDIWEEYSCERISFPALQKIQQEIMKKTGATFASE